MARPDARRGNRDPGRRTLRWRYLPLPSSLPDLRTQVRAALALWGIVGRVVEDVVLVVSELAANAIEHARTPLVVALGRDEEGVQVRVRDYSSDPPVLRSIDDDPRRGWGLRMIAGLAAWGWEPHPAGKTVWATIELPARNVQLVRP